MYVHIKDYQFIILFLEYHSKFTHLHQFFFFWRGKPPEPHNKVSMLVELNFWKSSDVGFLSIMDIRVLSRKYFYGETWHWKNGIQYAQVKPMVKTSTTKMTMSIYVSTIFQVNWSTNLNSRSKHYMVTSSPCAIYEVSHSFCYSNKEIWY